MEASLFFNQVKTTYGKICHLIYVSLFSPHAHNSALLKIRFYKVDTYIKFVLDSK